jgi:hypothetical protein
VKRWSEAHVQAGTCLRIPSVWISSSKDIIMRSDQPLWLDFLDQELPSTSFIVIMSHKLHAFHRTTRSGLILSHHPLSRLAHLSVITIINGIVEQSLRPLAYRWLNCGCCEQSLLPLTSRNKVVSSPIRDGLRVIDFCSSMQASQRYLHSNKRRW